MRQQWTMSARLWLLSGMLLAALGITATAQYMSILQLEGSLRNVTRVQNPATRSMTLVDMMHDGIMGIGYRAVLTGALKNTSEYESVRTDLKEAQDNIRKYLGDLEKLPLNPSTQKAIAEAKVPLEAYIDSAQKLVDHSLSDRVSAATKMMPDFQEQFEKLEVSLEKVGDLIQDGAKQVEEEGNQIADRANLISSAFALGGIFFGFIFAWFLIRSLSRELRHVTTILSQSSDEVFGASHQLRASADDLNASVTQQASAVQETAASMEEIASTMGKTQENADRLETTAKHSLNAAAEGQKSMFTLKTSIGDIRDANARILSEVENGNQRIQEIVKVIGEIDAKTKVIHEIVFQTKLLAFNASVEAARAGEHGKGFAVVAEEVGNLAQMSGNSAKEISDLLSSSLKKVEQIVVSNRSSVETLVEDSKVKLNEGMRLAEVSEQALEQIVEQNNQVTGMVTEITQTLREQKTGVDEVAKATTMLDRATQTTAKASNETSGVSGGLGQKADDLRQVVLRLNALVGGVSQSESSTSNGSPELTVAQTRATSGPVDTESNSKAA